MDRKKKYKRWMEEKIVSEAKKRWNSKYLIKLAKKQQRGENIEINYLVDSSTLEFVQPLKRYIGLMSISWTRKVKLFYDTLLANNSH